MTVNTSGVTFFVNGNYPAIVHNAPGHSAKGVDCVKRKPPVADKLAAPMRPTVTINDAVVMNCLTSTIATLVG